MSNFVLVVEDDRGHRKHVTETLADMGYRVESVASGSEARAFLAERGDDVSLVVTDLVMEHKDAGRKLVEWVARRRSPCRVGVWTAFGGYEDWQTQSRLPPVDFYLSKGDDWSTFRRHVQLALSDRPLDLRPPEKWRALQLAAGGRTEAVDPTLEVLESAFSLPDGDDPDPGFAPMRIRATFRPGALTFRDVDSQLGKFREVEMPRSVHLGEPGEPDLPGVEFRIALPAPATAVSVAVSDETWTRAKGDFRVLPVPEHAMEGGRPRYVVPARVYLANEMRPKRVVRAQPQWVDGMPFVHVTLFPVRNNPRTGELLVLTAATLDISAMPEPLLDDIELPPPDPHSPVRDLVLDSEHLWNGATAADAGRAEGGDRPPAEARSRPRYVAIGPAELLAAAEPLLDLRRVGFDVDAVRLGADLPLPTGAPPEQVAAAIRSHLQDRRRRGERIHHVLLVGGHDRIPLHIDPNGYRGRSMWVDVERIPILSDSWYTWNQAPERERLGAAVGRLPFSDASAVRAYCERCAAATRDGRAGWLFVTGHGKGYQTNVERILRDHGAKPPLRPVAKAPAGRSPRADVDEKLGAASETVAYRGHGRRHAWVVGEDADVDGRWSNVGRDISVSPPLHGVLSVACCTGNQAPPVPDCGACDHIPECDAADDALGTTWLASGAAYWFFGMTRPAWTHVNDALLQRIVEATTDTNARVADIGSALRRALLQILGPNATAYDEDVGRMAVLLGDPAWPLG